VLRAAQSRYQVAATFEYRDSTVRALVRAMRPYQWVKNLLCFVPAVAAGDFSAHGWLRALAIAAAFSLVASGIYILNDISDLAADRAHPRKSRRPFANGSAPIAAGLTLIPVMLLAGAFLGAVTNGWPALVVYLAVNLSYNFWFKEKPLIDVFALAALYALRLFGGSLAGGYGMSLWLLAFSSFLFLSLAVIKRVSELRRLRGSASASKAPRRGYTIDDIAILEMFGVAAPPSRSGSAVEECGNPADYIPDPHPECRRNRRSRGQFRCEEQRLCRDSFRAAQFLSRGDAAQVPGRPRSFCPASNRRQ
jgi:UbiA prenyltransferase family